jgi:hypothetical protein
LRQINAPPPGGLCAADKKARFRGLSLLLGESW